MAATVQPDGSIKKFNSKDNNQYFLTDSGKKFMKNRTGNVKGFIGTSQLFNDMMKAGHITEIPEVKVAEGNAGIAERNTASFSSGIDMFDSGNWLTKNKPLGTNIMTTNALASGSLLSLGGTLG